MSGKKIDKEKAKCTGMTIHAPLEILERQEDQEGSPVVDFVADAYTGEIIERLWGRLAIDISGIKAKQNIPILMNHDANKIVGYSTGTSTDLGKLQVFGRFSDVTNDGKLARGLAVEGFPWQASIGVSPSRVLSIDAGDTTEINGRELTGPAEIWMQSEVFETSFVPLGADGNTSVTTFSRFEEQEVGMEEEEKKEDLTYEGIKTKYPEILSKVRKEAADAERRRVKEVMSQTLPGHESLIETLAFDGMTTGPEAAVKVLAAEKALMSKARETFTEEAIAPVPTTVPPQKEAEDEITEENFKRHKELYEEFGAYDVYSAYIDAIEKGIVKTTGGK